MLKIIILLIPIYFYASCSNKFSIQNWGKDKYSMVSTDHKFLMAVTAEEEAQVLSHGTNIAAILNMRVQERDNLRHATTIYVVPKKSIKIKYEFEEVNSIKLSLTKGKELFRDSLSLRDRYDPNTGAYKFYILADSNIGFTEINVAVNDRELLQNEKIYFFEHLPYRAKIEFSEANSDKNTSNRRFCPNNATSCSDTLKVDISEMFDETDPGNQYFTDAKAKIEFLCKYWQQGGNKTIFTQKADCGIQNSFYTKQLGLDGKTNFNLTHFGKVVQIYFNRNIEGTPNGSVFGIPNFSFLKGEEDIEVALFQSNSDYIFNINTPNPSPFMFAYNRRKFFEENYPNENGEYNDEGLLSPIFNQSTSTLTSRDTKPNASTTSGPDEILASAQYKPFVFNLNQSKTFYYIPVSKESVSDVRALGALLKGNIQFNFIDSLTGMNYPEFVEGSNEYTYNFSVTSGSRAGRTRFNIEIDSLLSSYNKKIIVFPGAPIDLNFSDFIRNIGSNDSYAEDFELQAADMEVDHTDLYVDLLEEDVVLDRGGNFSFLIKPTDSFQNLWEEWDSSDPGESKRLYHNSIVVKDINRPIDFYRDPCDFAYSGAQEDPDSTDNSQINNPRCSVHLNTNDKDGSYIVQCYNFTIPAEYNIHPSGQLNPYNNVNFYWGYLGTPQNESFFSFKITPDEHEISGIAHHYYDPVQRPTSTTSHFLWGAKELRICPRNNKDYYVRDNEQNNYDFNGLPLQYASKRQLSGYQANLLRMDTLSGNTTRHVYPPANITLRYNSAEVINGERDERGRCILSDGRCRKEFSTEGDIIFYPIPGIDTGFSLSNTSGVIRTTNYRLRNSSGSAVTGTETINKYQARISQIRLLDGISLNNQNASICAHRTNNSLFDACDGTNYTRAASENDQSPGSYMVGAPHTRRCGKCLYNGDIYPNCCRNNQPGCANPSKSYSTTGACNGDDLTQIVCSNNSDFDICGGAYTKTACAERSASQTCYILPACGQRNYTYPNITYTPSNSPISDFNSSGFATFNIRKESTPQYSENNDLVIPNNSFTLTPYTNLCSGTVPNERDLRNIYRNIELHFEVRGIRKGAGSGGADITYRWLNVGSTPKSIP